MSEEQYQRVELGQYIVADPYICHGKPTFKGTRKLVHLVVEDLADSEFLDELVEQYDLPKEAVREAVRLAAQALREYFSVPHPPPEPLPPGEPLGEAVPGEAVA